MRFSFVALLTGLVSYVNAGLSNNELKSLSRSSKHGIIQLDDKNYKDILSGPRDYHLIVLMTSTSPQINCVLCNEFKPEYELTSSSYWRSFPDGIEEGKEQEEQEEQENGSSLIPKKNIYFLYSEFQKSRSLFNEFQLNNIPKIYYFPPSMNRQPNAFKDEMKEYQFYAGDHKELLIQWITTLTRHKFKIYIPPNYTRIGINIITTISIITLIVKFWGTVSKFLSSRNLWSSISLIFILLLISGYMFNQIRGVPYIRELGGNKLEYFQAGQQNQFGVETQIMSFLYGVLSLCIVILIKKSPEIKNRQIQFITIVIFSVLIFVFYSILLQIFRKKSGGYPFKLIDLIKV